MTIKRDDVITWITGSANCIFTNKQYLSQLDSDIGDADHGINMDRGFQAVMQKLPTISQQDIGSIFKTIGMTLLSTVGGASGPLYGTFFIQMGQAAAGKMELSLSDWTVTLEAGINGVLSRGKAQLGDKTMVDAWVPALNALKTSDKLGLAQALKQSADAAEQGMKDTIPLLAKKGRASYLGERSIGHQDPGATSAYYFLKTAAETWSKLS